MDWIQSLERYLNGVTTYGPAQVAIGDALDALGMAYNLPGISDSSIHDLDRARLPLESWYRAIAAVDPNLPYPGFAQKRSLISSAYTQIAGAEGQAHVTTGNHFYDSLEWAVETLPEHLGEGIGAVAQGAGDTIGKLLGGLLKGLGPFLVLVLIVALVFNQTVSATVKRSIGVGR